MIDSGDLDVMEHYACPRCGSLRDKVVRDGYVTCVTCNRKLYAAMTSGELSLVRQLSRLEERQRRAPTRGIALRITRLYTRIGRLRAERGAP